MNIRILTLACALLTGAGAAAQTVYDATTIARKELNGTARFVGMGGAMGALGGDISVIGTNPAGIGIYRSNDVMTTFGYSLASTETDNASTILSADKGRWNFDNIGAVISTKIGNVTPLRYVNFGFNYHKAKSFYRTRRAAGDLGGYTQLDVIAAQADGLTPSHWGNGNIFDNSDIGWLSALGWEGYLISPTLTDQVTDYRAQDENGNPLFLDPDGSLTTSPIGADGRPNVPAYENYDFYGNIAGEHPYLREFRSHERGGVDEYDLNVSFNVNDRVYLGLTVGIYDVDYAKYTLYNEDSEGQGGGGYQLESYNNLSGSGFDLKLGVILRPFEYSPLRIGLAVHTPVFYKLTYSTSAILTSDYTDHVVDTYDYVNGDMWYDFHLRTPWVLNASLGYTVGSYLALGAEYEYANYSNMDFRYPEGDAMDFLNDEAGYCLKGTHTLRLGAELKPISSFALRVGYNYATSAYKGDAYKALALNSLTTDTDFANLKSAHTVTLGVGYHTGSFYADLAYKYDACKADFYPFMAEGIQPMKAKDTRSKVLLTLGYRF